MSNKSLQADALTSHVMLDIVSDATNSASAFVLGLRLNGLSGRAKIDSLFRGSKLALDLVAPIE